MLYIFATQKKKPNKQHLNRDLGAILISTDLPGWHQGIKPVLNGAAESFGENKNSLILKVWTNVRVVQEEDNSMIYYVQMILHLEL